MAWTSPRTWVVGEMLTAALLNAHVRDDILWLAERIGTVVTGAATSSSSHVVLAGSEVVTTNGSGVTPTIAYGQTFGSTPVVVVCNGDAAVAGADDLAVNSRTTSGFTAKCAALSTSVRVNWIAVGA